MKYIITETKLNKLISNYLDHIDWWEWDIGDGEFNLSDGRYESSKILFRLRLSSWRQDYEIQIIYLSDALVSKISKLFSTEISDSIRAIIEWFNEKYDKSLTINDFEWMDDEGQDQDDN